ncbi:MAG: NmrA family NAD(P)-binding protein [Chitinophagaceae bacterium]
MKIIVSGSLGNISKPLATALIEKGHLVTVISSRQEKQQDIEALGATAAIGSLEDIDFLVSTLDGAELLYAMVPPNFNVPDSREYYRRLGNNYVQAIQRSGVTRVLHLSSYGAHLDKGTGFILGAHDVEGILNELPGIAITHLRPGYFFNNLYNFAGMIKGMGMIGANYGGDDRMVLVHPKDIAVAAAEEMETFSTGIKVLYVASDEHSASEVAQALGNAIGKPDLKWVTFTDEQTQGALENRGVPAHIARDFVEMGTSTHSGALRQDYDLHKPVLGKVKLEDFAKEFATAF